MTARRAPVPADLTEAGRKLWRAIAGQVADDGLILDARELRILHEAARTADELTRLQTALAEAPLSVPGSMGQTKIQPLFEEVRRHRGVLVKLLAQLDLADPAEAPARGQRGNPGDSSVHRGAANMRWHGHIHGLPGGA